jgi:hypothetical protein
MRAVRTVMVVVICVGVFGVRAAGAAAVLPVSGGALGSGFFLPGVTADGQNVWEERGGYATSGQLGKGDFDFQNPSFSTACPSSGTGRLVRSDGAVLVGTVTRTGTCSGAPGSEQITFDAAQGSRDLVGAHLVLTGQPGVGEPPPEPGALFSVALQIRGELTVASRIGYVMTDVGGHVSAFGGAPSLGDAPTSAATRIALTPSRNGYWIVNAAGAVYAFGDAHWYGNAPALSFGEIVRSIASTTTNRGYWLFTSTGRALPFGDAKFYGDVHTSHLNGAIVDAVPTADHRGYYLVGADGGVFSFGDAKFYGSTGDLHLNQPVDGIAPTATGGGYWLVAADGGVFTFGDARFRGSMGGHRLNQPVNAIARYGTGYLLVATDGGIFNFSDQLFFGSRGATPTAPIIAVASTG